MNWCTSDGQLIGSQRPADLVAELPGPLRRDRRCRAEPGDHPRAVRALLRPGVGSVQRPCPSRAGQPRLPAGGSLGLLQLLRFRGPGSSRSARTPTPSATGRCSPSTPTATEIGGCDAGSPIYQWLQNALASSTARCQLAYWHHPRWSQGVAHGNDAELGPMFSLLYQYRVELLLSGHDHAYQRFAALNPSGGSDTRGCDPDRGRHRRCLPGRLHEQQPGSDRAEQQHLRCARPHTDRKRVVDLVRP